MSDHPEKRSIKDRVKSNLKAASIGAAAGATVAYAFAVKDMRNRIPGKLIRDVVEHGDITIRTATSGTVIRLIHQTN